MRDATSSAASASRPWATWEYKSSVIAIRRVAEPLGDDLGVDTGLQGLGGVAVAEVVEADAGQFGVAHDAIEHLRETVGMDGTADLVGEHEVTVVRPRVTRGQSFLELTHAMRPARVERDRVERDAAPALAE